MIEIAPYYLEFEHQTLPSTTNSQSGTHWRRKQKEAKSWDNIVMYWGMKWGIPKKPLATAHLILTRFSSREPDFDGLVSSFKMVIDSLVTNGILLNDRRENIGVPDYVWQKARAKEGKIRVVVKEER